MDNVVHIGNTQRGFTRMDNNIMDALMAIDLPARELKVALYIAKATINFQAGARRITAASVSKATNIHPDAVSRAISRLLKRRVIYREGGARGDIGLCDPKEWIFVEQSNRTSTRETDVDVRVVSIAKLTKTDDSLLYSKKEAPVTLPSEEITSPQPEAAPPATAAKADRKTAFGLASLIADNPHGIPEQVLVDWLASRKAQRAAVTATVWRQFNTEFSKLAAYGITAEQALAEALAAGWRGLKCEWVLNRLNTQARHDARSSGPNFDDTSWADDLGDL